MSLHPSVKELIKIISKSITKPAHAMTISEYREVIKNFHGKAGEMEELKWVENRHIIGPYGEIPIRIYSPKQEVSKSVLIYFKGSGFVSGDLDEQDPLCRALANRTQGKVVAVGYRGLLSFDIDPIDRIADFLKTN